MIYIIHWIKCIDKEDSVITALYNDTCKLLVQ